MTTSEVNAKAIADMDEAQASFMAARAEKNKAEEIRGVIIAANEQQA